MVTITEVRNQLAGLSSTLISDATIQQQIDIATAFVDNIKSTSADATLVEKAKLLLASYYTYVAYVEIIHREIGDVPISSRIQLETLRRQVDSLLALIEDPRKRLQTVAPAGIVAIESTESTLEEYYETTT